MSHIGVYVLWSSILTAGLSAPIVRSVSPIAWSSAVTFALEYVDIFTGEDTFSTQRFCAAQDLDVEVKGVTPIFAAFSGFRVCSLRTASL